MLKIKIKIRKKNLTTFINSTSYRCLCFNRSFKIKTNRSIENEMKAKLKYKNLISNFISKNNNKFSIKIYIYKVK